jgi:hypothetical protein
LDAKSMGYIAAMRKEKELNLWLKDKVLYSFTKLD